MKYANNLPQVMADPLASWQTIAANEFELKFSNRMLLRLHIPTSKRSKPSVRLVPFVQTVHGIVAGTPIDLPLHGDRDINNAKEDLIKIAKHVNASVRAEYAMREWDVEVPRALAMGYDFERYAERELKQTEIPEWVWEKVCGEHGNPGLN